MKVLALKNELANGVTFIYCSCQKNWVADKTQSGAKNAASRRKYVKEHGDHDLVSWTRELRDNHRVKKSDLRMDIDLVAQICGHFCDCETNNGYGCDHPENKDTPGECHRCSCPVASYDSDKDEMVVYDPQLIEEIKHGATECDKSRYREWKEKQLVAVKLH